MEGGPGQRFRVDFCLKKHSTIHFGLRFVANLPNIGMDSASGDPYAVIVECLKYWSSPYFDPILSFSTSRYHILCSKCVPFL
jgi:hypothetical protein